MGSIRLAHFSDIHYTLPPAPIWKDWSNKYISGYTNYYIGGRKQHFKESGQRIKKLFQSIENQRVDHSICSGDLTQWGSALEFEGVAHLWGKRRSQPDQYTAIPGNHDRYSVQSTVENRFGRWFGEVAAPQGEYPGLKLVAQDQVAVVLLDASRPTGLTDSSGCCGSSQLKKLEELLKQDVFRSVPLTILTLHYGLFRGNGQPDRKKHGLRDYLDLLSILNDSQCPVKIVIHGHMHQSYVLEAGRCCRPMVICAGSATDLSVHGGWNLLEYTADRQELTVERWSWAPDADQYIAKERRTCVLL